MTKECLTIMRSLIFLLAATLGIVFSGNALSVERGGSSTPALPIPKIELPDKKQMEAELEKFSTKPIKIRLENSEKTFVIPRNYFLPNNAADPDEIVLDQFGFTLFLPNFEGYSLETAQYYPAMRENDELITILTVAERNKEFLIDRNGERHPARPTAWGDPQALFDSWRPRQPARISEENDLECHVWHKEPNSDAICKGTRANGEMLFMRQSLICQVQYYSEQEQLYVRYNYSRRNCEKWREIDDAIWAKLHAWRVK